MKPPLPLLRGVLPGAYEFIYGKLNKLTYFDNLRKYKRLIFKPAMKKIMIELKRRGISLHGFKALEVFGGSAENTALIYAPFVAELEIWEINPELETNLRRNFPKATVKITDSYYEMRRAKGKYDLIVADNYIYNTDFKDHVEHFDIFPHIFNLINEIAILIFVAAPVIDNQALKYYPWWLDETHSAKRKDFYRTENPRDVTNCYIDVYKDISESNGFEIEWFFQQMRGPSYVYFFVLKLRRKRKD